MSTRTVRITTALAIAGLACHCGSSTPAAGPNTIVISNFSYSPANLAVAPGTNITAQNVVDGMEHTVTSQSQTGNFVPGSVAGVSFDTGLFTGETTFTIPSSAPIGTVIPYFCSMHLQMMGQGQITVIAP